MNVITEAALEYKLLSHYIADMERQGQTRKGHVFDIDDRLVESLYEQDNVITTLSELEKACNYCVTHEYIEHRGISNKYGFLSLTDKGVGVVRSIQASEKMRRDRSPAKKLSDWVIAHKGLVALGGFLLALVTLIINN